MRMRRLHKGAALACVTMLAVASAVACSSSPHRAEPRASTSSPTARPRMGAPTRSPSGPQSTAARGPQSTTTPANPLTVTPSTAARPGAGSSSAASPSLPGVVANCTAPGNAAYDTTTKPTSIVIACADAGVGFQDLSWTSWTTSSAMGAGQLWKNDCTPNCAQGTVHRYAAFVSLTTIVGSINGPVFSAANANYPNGGPNGQASGMFSLPVPPPVTPVCSAEQLQGSVSNPGGAATSQEFVQLTNVSSQPCHMQGFPGLDLINSSGTSIVNAGRGCPWASAGSCATQLDYVSLPAHGGAASFGFAWQSTPAPGQQCPESASALVTPPNAFDHLTLPLQIAVCGDPLRLGVGTVQ